jgi:hypothetical protein
MDDNKKKGNPLWVAGVSGNPSGKPKGAKRNPLTINDPKKIARCY